MDEVLAEELLITSYEYQSHTPFLFTKFYSHRLEEYNQTLTNVTQSSAAAPIYFPPKLLPGKVPGETLVMVDGGIYANDPSL
eukprot:CAMPEP_0202964536 /NCGR_PEP_ID=MMETSP1396-20130829/8621_1 /ASSEMBLY_ACC=CAM_ASM_000872 /TAXON_ID= /ORGANISM="Pseudokeronopsis sp., Strain Brazil" /LENGTH=81 /DNA_ID=CAMNT_0049686713 /DNA_START=52 /DNA_END=294 /DNA_ORIENTATION=-